METLALLYILMGISLLIMTLKIQNVKVSFRRLALWSKAWRSTIREKAETYSTEKL